LVHQLYVADSWVSDATKTQEEGDILANEVVQPFSSPSRESGNSAMQELATALDALAHATTLNMPLLSDLMAAQAAPLSTPQEEKG
jgi:hypothetical protein